MILDTLKWAKFQAPKSDKLGSLRSSGEGSEYSITAMFG
jgi:hypothetical protein